jgi:hypothetical protein
MNQGLDGDPGLLSTPGERLLDKAVVFGFAKPIRSNQMCHSLPCVIHFPISFRSLTRPLLSELPDTYFL